MNQQLIFMIYFGQICISDLTFQVGGVAHMVERSLRMREARGSIPRTSISFVLALPLISIRFIVLVGLTQLIEAKETRSFFSLSLCLC